MDNGSVNNYFAGANSGQGFYSLYEYLGSGCKRVFIIKGGPGTGKSTFMKRTAKEMLKRDYQLEQHWCSSDSQSLDGLVIKDLKVAILDGTAPHLVDPNYPGVVDEIINLGRYWDRETLVKNKTEIISLTEQNRDCFKRAYSHLADAYQIWQKKEKIYQKQAEQNGLEDELIEFCQEVLEPKETESSSRHLFASAITPKAVVDYTSEIVEANKKLILLKASERQGTKLLAKIAKLANARGYKTTCFHQPLVPEMISLLEIKELDLVILNDSLATSFKDIELLKIFNFKRKLALTSNTKDSLKDLSNQQQKEIDLAVTDLAEAKKIHDLLEDNYIKAMDFAAVEKRRKAVIAKLL